MGELAKISIFIFMLAILPLIYSTFLAYSSWNKGYSWQEMDWDNNGHTSIGEFLLSGDTGTRPLKVNGKNCREVYDYKDGLSLKTLCPD